MLDIFNSIFYGLYYVAGHLDVTKLLLVIAVLIIFMLIGYIVRKK